MLPDTLGPFEEIARKLDEYNKRLSHLERLEAAAGGAWTLIETIELAMVAASIDFQNIPATFKHLKIIGSARSSVAGTGDGVDVRFNNDSGNNYDYILAEITHAANLQTFQGRGVTFIALGIAPGNTAAANKFGPFEFVFPDYLDTSNHQSAIGLCHDARTLASGTIGISHGAGTWRSASAITRITIIQSTGPNWLAGSMASLYGISG